VSIRKDFFEQNFFGRNLRAQIFSVINNQHQPLIAAIDRALSLPEFAVPNLGGPNLGYTDGIVQLWFDDMGGFRKTFGSPKPRFWP
jgi:hypothetical protein